jgi:pimeloyl-ACP methyl ester carboxylesterase
MADTTIRRRHPLSYVPAIVIGIALAAFALAADSGFAPVGGARALSGAPGIYEWTFEAVRGPSAFDRIALHRIAHGPDVPGRLPKGQPPSPSVISPASGRELKERSQSFAGEPRAVLLYLPGTNMNGEVAIDDPRYNFVEYLATHGIDTWSMDYRTHFVPPDTKPKDLAELARWTNELFEADIDAAADYVIKTTGRPKLFLAGFSRGVEFAYLFAARHPDRVAGLVVLDGFIPEKPMMSGRPERYADDIGGRHLTYEKRKALMELVIKNPDAPAPIAKYRTARENLEHVVYDSAGFGGKGGLANPQGGFSDPVVLAHVLVLYDRYWPSIQDYENLFTPELRRALASSRIPVIAFSSTNIASRWPAMVHASAQSTGSHDVTFREMKGWGHLDVLCGTHAEKEVFAPAAEWIMQRAK